MNNKPRRLTFNQELQLSYFYELRRKRRMKELNNFLKGFINGWKVIFKVIIFLAAVMLSGLLGFALIPIIYLLNYPLGILYALFAACCISAILGWVFIPRGESK